MKKTFEFLNKLKANNNRDWFQENNTNFTINPEGPETGTYKVQRGGQFTGREKHTRAADRQRAEPNKRDFYVGFRVAHNALNN